jgi:hypothetical protein
MRLHQEENKFHYIEIFSFYLLTPKLPTYRKIIKE